MREEWGTRAWMAGWSEDKYAKAFLADMFGADAHAYEAGHGAAEE